MRKLLLKFGLVVTQDKVLGILPTGDVLVEDERIAAVAPKLSAAGAETIDCTGHFVLPGLINAHMHTWQTALRSVAANWTLLEYFRHVHAGLATVFTPEDIHIATLAGALNQLDHGVTTLVDWCHNNPTPEHTDAGVAGLKESGIRAAFFHGSTKPTPGPASRISLRSAASAQRGRAAAERLPWRIAVLRDPGHAVLGPHYSTPRSVPTISPLARDLGLVASMHQGGGEAKTPGGWETLMQQGLVGPHINIVHGNISATPSSRPRRPRRQLLDHAENEMRRATVIRSPAGCARWGRRHRSAWTSSLAIGGDMFHGGAHGTGVAARPSTTQPSAPAAAASPPPRPSPPPRRSTGSRHAVRRCLA